MSENPDIFFEAMADWIEKIGVAIEAHQKQIDELQVKYDDQNQQCSSLSNELDATQQSWVQQVTQVLMVDSQFHVMLDKVCPPLDFSAQPPWQEFVTYNTPKF